MLFSHSAAARLTHDQTAGIGGDILEGSFLASFLDPFLAPFLYTFFEQFWRQNCFKNSSKIAPKSAIFLGRNFCTVFFEFLELCGCLLGAFLGLQRLSSEASGLQKPQKTYIYQVFAKTSFFSP